MKRGLIFFAVLLVLLFNIIGSAEITGDVITGDTITGKASNFLGINITILTAPKLNITIPKNNTYIDNNSLPLFFTSDQSNSSIWYNLDSGTNITITGPTTFNTSEGGHILYLFANNSNGETAVNVSFSVNITKLFTVIYSEYNGSLRGISTNYNNISYIELQNLSNITLENAEHGRIFYNASINITDDADFSDRILNLDVNTNISFNRIELNATALPNFNRTASLYLYNLTFSNPRILRYGSVCPSDVCIEESYTNGILKFNVTEFSVYSAEEIPVLPSPEGGGRNIPIQKDFSIDKEKIIISFKLNESIKKETIILKNTGDINLRMELENKFGQFLVFNETNFLLNKGDSKTISLVFTKNDNIVPGTYIGKIIVNGGGIKKEILIVLEVESIEPLFDVILTIPEKFQIITQGENLVLESDIINLGDPIKNKLLVNYIIKDLDDNIIVMNKDFVSINDKLFLTKEIKLPRSLDNGNYIAIIEVIYQDSKAVSSRFFQVKALEYILLGFNYGNGKFDLIERTLENGYSPTISHDPDKKYKFNLLSSDEEILYTIPVDDPGAFFSELFVEDKIEGGLEEFELDDSFYIIAPEKRKSEKFQVLLEDDLDEGSDNVVAEGDVFDIGAKSCRVR